MSVRIRFLLCFVFLRLILLPVAEQKSGVDIV